MSICQFLTQLFFHDHFHAAFPVSVRTMVYSPQFNLIQKPAALTPCLHRLGV